MSNRWQGTMMGGLALLVVATGAQAGPEQHQRGISVQGEAELRVVPDRAELSVAVEIEHEEADTASEAANASAAAFLEAIEQLGVDQRAIQSASLRLSPQYRWDDKKNQREQVGFSARRDISVQVHQLKRLPRFLSAATEAGMTHIAPPRLYASDAKVHQREALAQAMADARSNAAAIAKAADRAVGEVLAVDARNEQRQPIQPRAMMRSSADSAEQQGEAAFSAGEIVYSARLQAHFAFAP